MANSAITDLFRVAVREDFDAVERLSKQIGEDNWGAAAGCIAAVFGLAVHRRFPPGSDVQTISVFVSQTRDDIEEGGDIRPLEAETLIRAALGETQLAEGIPADVAVPTQVVLTIKMLRDEQLSDADLDQFLKEANDFAMRWKT